MSDSLDSTCTSINNSYGEQGWELFHDVLHSAFIKDPLLPSLDLTQSPVLKSIQPLTTHEFLDQVLLPELVCMLIQDDLGGEEKGITYEKAMEVRQESSKFGIAMYASDTAFSAHDTKRASGSWIGASPKRAKKDKSYTPPSKSKEHILIQQKLPVRRSERKASLERVSYVDLSSSDEDEHFPAMPKLYHQQRLHMPQRNQASPRPNPRPTPRFHETGSG